MVQIQRPAGVNVGVNNPAETVYIKGTELLDGSFRVTLNGGNTLILFEERVAGVWVSADIATSTVLTTGQVPKADTDGTLIYGGATVDPTTGEWTFDESINVPAGSVSVGTTLELSEGGQDLVIADLISGQMAFSVNSDFDDATGSEAPTYIDFGTAQNTIPQPDFSTPITANPLIFSFASTVIAPNTRLTDRIVLKANTAITNFRVKITDQASGVVIRYMPNQSAWEGVTPGVDLIAGDNTFFQTQQGTDTPGNFFLGYVPFVTLPGQVLDVELIADAMDLLGTAGGIPYFETEIHDGPTKALVSGPDTTTATAVAVFADTVGTLEDVPQVLITTDAIDTDITILPVTATGHGNLEFSTFAGLSRGFIEYSEAINRFGIFVDASTAVFEINNLAANVDTQVFLTDDATFAITASGANTNPPFSIESSGGSGALINWYMSAVDPEGVITASPGDICVVSDGVNSRIWQLEAASIGNTGWVSQEGGNVSGPATTTINSIATWGATDGSTLLNNTSALVETGLNDVTVQLKPVTAIGFADLQILNFANADVMIMEYDDLSDTFDFSVDNVTSFGLRNLSANIDIDISVTGDAAVDISASGANTNPPLKIASTGANGNQTSFFTSVQIPEGNISGEPGDITFYSAGAASAIYQQKNAIAGNTGWLQVGGVAGLDKEVQFNDGGVFGSEAGFEYDKTIDLLTAENIGVGTTNPISALTLIGEMTIGSSVTDNSHQFSRIKSRNYSLANPPALMMASVDGVSNNTMFIGGGLSQDTSHAEIAFYTTPLPATLVGTRRVTINEIGLGVGTIGRVPESPLHVYENTVNTGATAGLTIEQDGTGDAVTQYLLTGGQRFVTGIDNTDDAYKISVGTGLGTNDALVIDPSGDVTITAGVTIENTATDTDFTINPITAAGDGKLEFETFAGLSRAFIEYSESINRFGIFVDSSTAVFEINNLAADVDIQVFLTDDATFAISASGADTNPPLEIASTGSNGNQTAFYTSDRIPEGNISANPGDIDFVSFGEDSGVFIKKSAAFGNTGWVEIGDTFSQAGTTVVGAVAVYNDASGKVIADVETMRILTSATSTLALIEPVTAAGTASLGFFNASSIEQAAITFNQPTDTLLITSALCDIDFLTGSGIVGFNSGENTQSILRIESPITTSKAAIEFLDNSSVLQLELKYDGALDVTSITDASTNGLDINSGAGFVRIGAALTVQDAFEVSEKVPGLPVMTVGVSGRLSNIFVENVNPEGVITGKGGDISIRDDDELSSISLKKSTALSAADWYTVSVNAPDVFQINNTAELEELATAGIITATSDTTLVIGGAPNSATEMVTTATGDLHITAENRAVTPWFYTGTGDFLSGEGGARVLSGALILSAATGTFLNLTGATFNLTGGVIIQFDDLGSITDGILISRSAVYGGCGIGFELINTSVEVADIAFNGQTDTGSIFDIKGTLAGVKIQGVTAIFATSGSLVRLDPAIVNNSINISGCNIIDGVMFDTSGALGTFTAVADAAEPAEAITSVTDSSGVARFNFTAPPTLFVNQEVVISTFITNTAYNGTFIITATGANFFEVSSIPFGTNETGSFLSNSVTITDTATSLVDGDTLTISTDGALDYDGGATVYNQLTNSFQINRTFTVTKTGTWSTKGLDQTDPRVLAFGTPGFPDSTVKAEISVNGNTAVTDIPAAGARVMINATPWTATTTERIKEDVDGDAIFFGLEPISAKLDGNVLLEPSSSSKSLSCQFCRQDAVRVVVTFTNGTNIINETGHSLSVGSSLTFHDTAGTLPAELRVDVVYYVINTNANDFQVSYTLGGPAVTFTDNGSGTNSYAVADLHGSKPVEPIAANNARTLVPQALESLEYGDKTFIIVTNEDDAVDIEVTDAYYRIVR